MFNEIYHIKQNKVNVEVYKSSVFVAVIIKKINMQATNKVNYYLLRFFDNFKGKKKSEKTKGKCINEILLENVVI